MYKRLKTLLEPHVFPRAYGRMNAEKLACWKVAAGTGILVADPPKETKLIEIINTQITFLSSYFRCRPGSAIQVH